MKRFQHFLVWSGFFLLVMNLSANERECTPESEGQLNQKLSLINELMREEKNPSQLWVEMRSIYQLTQRTSCDDGYMAEGISEGVLNLLVRKWKDLGPLLKSMQKDKKYGDFILQHIDATGNPDDLMALKKLSSDHCLKNYRSICKAIETRIAKALNEQEALQSQ